MGWAVCDSRALSNWNEGVVICIPLSYILWLDWWSEEAPTLFGVWGGGTYRGRDANWGEYGTYKLLHNVQDEK